MKLTILGNNSAIAAYDRHPTAQIVEIKEQLFLVDCGEGTQLQMQKYNIHRRRINYIFISHLHGDHYFGLIGLLSSMALMGRTQPIFLYGPPELEPILHLQLKAAQSILNYPLHFTPIYPDEHKVLVNTPHYKVTCFPVSHRIPCHGFVFEAKQGGRKILAEKCADLGVPNYFYKHLKEGEDYQRKDGVIIPNHVLTEDPLPSKKYAYCADTLYTENFLNYIQGVDLLYHESTYLNVDSTRAYERFHATAAQAAKIALKAKASQLLLGHFSSKYEELDCFEEEASSIFSNATVSKEGMLYEIA